MLIIPTMMKCVDYAFAMVEYIIIIDYLFLSYELPFAPICM